MSKEKLIDLMSKKDSKINISISCGGITGFTSEDIEIDHETLSLYDDKLKHLMFEMQSYVEAIVTKEVRKL